MSKIIGGHPGMEVLLEDDGTIVKVAKDLVNEVGLRNENRLLKLLEGEGVAPKSLKKTKTKLMQERVDGWNLRDATDRGEVVIQDGEGVRRNAVRFLSTLREHRVRHGDLTPPNLFITAGDRIVAVDWQQSHLFSEPFPDRRTSDSFLLWRTLSQMPSKVHPTPDTPRVIRRWMAVAKDLGGEDGVDALEGVTLLDLGCYAGDFCGMAAADGMKTTGVDLGGFNPEVDSLEWANSLWPHLSFIRTNIMDVTNTLLSEHEVVLLFSTWSYLVKDYGRDAASDLISRITKNSRVLYFENQLFGDGPGPEFFQSDSDISDFLKGFGKVKKLTTIPVTGRNASRSVWSVS